MLNVRRKFFLVPILFLFMFFAFSQAVFSDDYIYTEFKDENTKKWGFKDISGNIVISPEFDAVLSFSEELAAVTIGTKNGYINKKGELIITTNFDACSNFHDGVALVELNQKYGVIDNKGKIIIPAKFDSIDDFNFIDGFARVNLNRTNGFVDKKGNFVIHRPKDLEQIAKKQKEEQKKKYNDDYKNVMSYANSGNYDQALSSFYYMNKKNPYYKEVSKKIAGWKQLKSKKDADEKLRSDLTTAESYASSQQYNQAINYAQQISKKNPYYKQAQNRILEWKDAMLNMSNNSNNNSNTYTPPQKDNSAEEGRKNREQMRKNCIATCKSALSVCESNAQYLSNDDGGLSGNSTRKKALYKCERDYKSCEYSCGY